MAQIITTCIYVFPCWFLLKKVIIACMQYIIFRIWQISLLFWSKWKFSNWFFQQRYLSSKLHPAHLSHLFTNKTFQWRNVSTYAPFYTLKSLKLKQLWHLSLYSQKVPEIKIQIPLISWYVITRLYNNHICREVSPGLDAPRVAGSFPNSLSEARWVGETSSRA
jgi:hypothetical protein